MEEGKHTVDCSNIPVGEYEAIDHGKALKRLTREQKEYLKRLRKEWKFERVSESGNIIFSKNYSNFKEEIELDADGFFTVHYLSQP